MRAGGPRTPSSDQALVGIYYGVVTDNKDSEGLARVKVRLPWLDGSEQEQTHWAVLATPMSGASFGWYTLPDPGDTVAVMFLAGDIRRPVVLGGVHSRGDEPWEKNADGKNDFRGYRSRSGSRVLFDDSAEKKVVLVDRSGDNVIAVGSLAKGGEGENATEPPKGPDVGQSGVSIAAMKGKLNIHCPMGTFKVQGKGVKLLAKTAITAMATAMSRVESAGNMKVSSAAAGSMDGMPIDVGPGAAVAAVQPVAPTQAAATADDEPAPVTPPKPKGSRLGDLAAAAGTRAVEAGKKRVDASVDASKDAFTKAPERMEKAVVDHRDKISDIGGAAMNKPRELGDRTKKTWDEVQGVEDPNKLKQLQKQGEIGVRSVKEESKSIKQTADQVKDLRNEAMNARRDPLGNIDGVKEIRKDLDDKRQMVQDTKDKIKEVEDLRHRRPVEVLQNMSRDMADRAGELPDEVKDVLSAELPADAPGAEDYKLAVAMLEVGAAAGAIGGTAYAFLGNKDDEPDKVRTPAEVNPQPQLPNPVVGNPPTGPSHGGSGLGGSEPVDGAAVGSNSNPVSSQPPPGSLVGPTTPPAVQPTPPTTGRPGTPPVSGTGSRPPETAPSAQTPPTSTPPSGRPSAGVGRPGEGVGNDLPQGGTPPPGPRFDPAGEVGNNPQADGNQLGPDGPQARLAESRPAGSSSDLERSSEPPAAEAPAKPKNPLKTPPKGDKR